MAKNNNEYEIGSNKHVNGRQRARGGPGGGPGGRGGQGGEKPKNFGQSMGKLVRYLRPWLPAIIVALAMAAGATVMSLVGPNQISRITDMITAGITGTIDLAAIGAICLSLVAIYGLSFLFNYA